jgi:hypothetical protein
MHNGYTVYLSASFNFKTTEQNSMKLNTERIYTKPRSPYNFQIASDQYDPDLQVQLK